MKYFGLSLLMSVSLLGGRLHLLHAATCPSPPPVSADNLVGMNDFGALPDQGVNFDTTPLFNCALAFAKTYNLRAIYFSQGTYTFNTAPHPIDFPITVLGNGKGRTSLYRNYNGSGAKDGLLTFVAGSASSSVRDLGIVAGQGTSHGSAISLISSDTPAPNGAGAGPDFSFFSNLYLSAAPGGNWDVTVWIDGRARTSEPIGLRDLDFQNCSVFGATGGAMSLEGVVAFNFVGGGVFQAGGVSGTSGKILVSPSYNGVSGLPSYYVNINSTFVDGVLMQASEHSHYVAYFTAPITTSSFSVDNIVIGHVVGGVQPFWQASKYIDPEN